MKNTLRLVLSFVVLAALSGCATFDNITKLPVGNLSVEPEFESADFYNTKTLAITVFDPDGSYYDYRYGDRNLIDYGKLFAKSMQAKRPLIGLVSQDQLSEKISNRDWVSLSTRIARKTLADSADLEALAELSGANFIAIAKVRGFSERTDVIFDFPNTRLVEYRSAMATFTLYDAKTGQNIWFGNLDHETDDSWGMPSWQYMMERMYDGFVLRLPTPPKESKS